MEKEIYVVFWWESQKERYYKEGLETDGKIILR
jgi:hypothetical protein